MAKLKAGLLATDVNRSDISRVIVPPMLTTSPPLLLSIVPMSSVFPEAASAW